MSLWERSLPREMWVNVHIDFSHGSIWVSCVCIERSTFWLYFLCESTHWPMILWSVNLLLSSEDADFSMINSYQIFPTCPSSHGHKLAKSQDRLKDTQPEIKASVEITLPDKRPPYACGFEGLVDWRREFLKRRWGPGKKQNSLRKVSVWQDLGWRVNGNRLKNRPATRRWTHKTGWKSQRLQSLPHLVRHPLARCRFLGSTLDCRPVFRAGAGNLYSTTSLPWTL